MGPANHAACIVADPMSTVKDEPASHESGVTCGLPGTKR